MAEQGFITTASQLPPPPRKAQVRSALLAAAASIGSASGWVDRRLRLPRTVFLCFHTVFPEELDALRTLLRGMVEEDALTDFGSAVDSVTAGATDRPRVAVTFDDGFDQQVQASRVLDEIGIRACYFVCPSMLDRPRPEITARFCRERLRRPPLPMMDWDQAGALLDRGHAIGCHTRTHPMLRHCSAAQVQDEIAGAAETLRARLGEVRHFAWPFGRFSTFSHAAAEVVQAAGFETCASAERGAHAGDAAMTGLPCLRRVPLEPGMSIPAARMELALAPTVRGAGWPERWHVGRNGRPPTQG